MELLLVQDPLRFQRPESYLVRNLGSKYQLASIELEDGSGSIPALLKGVKQRRRRSDPVLARTSPWIPPGTAAAASAPIHPGTAAAAAAASSSSAPSSIHPGTAVDAAAAAASSSSAPSSIHPGTAVAAAAAVFHGGDGDGQRLSHLTVALGAGGSREGLALAVDGDGCSRANDVCPAALGAEAEPKDSPKRRCQEAVTLGLVDAVERDRDKRGRVATKRRRQSDALDDAQGPDAASTGAADTIRSGRVDGDEDLDKESGRKRRCIADEPEMGGLSLGAEAGSRRSFPVGEDGEGPRVDKELLKDADADAGASTGVARVTRADVKMMHKAMKKRGRAPEIDEPPWALAIRQVQEENRKVREENRKAQEENKAELLKVREENRKVQEKNQIEIQKLQQENATIKGDIAWHNLELYHPLGINRMVALVEILEQAASFVSFEVRKAVNEQDRLWRLVSLDEKTKPFEQYDKCAVDFRALWTFVFDFDAAASGLTLGRWWRNKYEVEPIGPFPSDWDKERYCAGDKGTVDLCRDVLSEALKAFVNSILGPLEEKASKQEQSDRRGQEAGISAVLAYMLTYMKSERNAGVHTMAILKPLKWGKSTSTFLVDVRDVQIKKISPGELITKINVLLDIAANAFYIIGAKLHEGLSLVLSWYATQLGMIASMFAPKHENGVTYWYAEPNVYTHNNGHWYVNGQEKTLEFLGVFASMYFS